MNNLITIDEYSPIGNAQEDINNNFNFLDIRTCKIVDTKNKLDPFFSFVQTLSADLMSWESTIHSLSGAQRATASLVHAVSGYWLEPITFMYPSTFVALGNFPEIENWLQETFAATDFAEEQIIRVTFGVKNYDPVAVNNTYMENISIDALVALAENYKLTVEDITKYLVYTNHVNSVIYVVNNILKRLNKTNLYVKDRNGLRSMLAKFSISKGLLYNDDLAGVPQYDLKLIYSYLIQYDILDKEYERLLALEIDKLPALVLNKFYNQNLFNTYIGSFCFLRDSEGYWEYIPECNIKFCVDDVCGDCWDYVDPNTLYPDRTCKGRVSQFDADYFVVRYTFAAVTGGMDLDTRTSITSPESCEVVGWCKASTGNGSNGVWYSWGGDNRGYGIESVLIDVAKIREAYPVQDIKGRISLFWYEAREGGDFVIQLEAYKGGTMALNGYSWENSGGELTGILYKAGNSTTDRERSCIDGDFVTNFTYAANGVFSWA